jgi:enoyl-CoA hydratase
MQDYSEFPALQIEQEGEAGEIFVVTINRPDRLNAIDPVTHTQIGRVWRVLDRDDDCRCIVLTGAGRAFCAGMDFKREPSSGDGAQRRYRRMRARPGASKLVDYILEVEKPIVTMINGPAIGMGLILALLGDISVASTDASLADTHIDIGVPPGDGGILLLPMILGMNKAKEMLMTGDPVSGEEAARIGLVNHAVAPDQLRAFTLGIAAKLAAKAPYAMKTTKASLNMILRRRALDVLDLSHLYEQIAMRTDDHKEGVRAKVEKRDPKFRGY